MYNSFFIDSPPVTCFAMTPVDGAPSSRAMYAEQLLVSDQQQRRLKPIDLPKQTSFPPAQHFRVYPHP